MAHGRHDLLRVVEHSNEHRPQRRVHSHVLHRPVAAYEKDCVKPIRVNVFNPHGRCQGGADALHVILLLRNFGRIVVVVRQIETQRINSGIYSSGLAIVTLRPASVNLRWGVTNSSDQKPVGCGFAFFIVHTFAPETTITSEDIVPLLFILRLVEPFRASYVSVRTNSLHSATSRILPATPFAISMWP
jgi:hypothetical protein